MRGSGSGAEPGQFAQSLTDTNCDCDEVRARAVFEELRTSRR